MPDDGVPGLQPHPNRHDDRGAFAGLRRSTGQTPGCGWRYDSLEARPEEGVPHMEVVPFPRGPHPAAVRAGVRLAERRTQRLDEQLDKVSALAAAVRASLERDADALDRIAAAIRDLEDIVAASDDILALAANAAMQPPHAFLAAVDYHDDPELAAALCDHVAAANTAYQAAARERRLALEALARIAGAADRAMRLVCDHPPFVAPLDPVH